MKYLAELFMPHKKKQVFISNIFFPFPFKVTKFTIHFTYFYLHVHKMILVIKKLSEAVA